MSKKNPITRKKRRRSAKGPVLFVVGVVSLVFVLVSVLGYSLASESNKARVENDFSVADLQTEILEEFTPPGEFTLGKDYTKKVQIKNVGEGAQFLRVLVSPELSSVVKKEEISELFPTEIGQEIALLDSAGQAITDSADWVNGQDGYYYYIKGLDKDQTSPALFEKVKIMPSVSSLIGGATVTLTLHVKVESIHTTKWAYRDAWWQGETPTALPLLTVDNALKLLAN